MRSIRDIKRKARRDLHQHMRVAALYLATPTSTPLALHVRIHTKWDATTMDGGSGNGTMVARQSIFPKILFMLDEVEAQGASSVAAGSCRSNPVKPINSTLTNPPMIFR